MILFWVPITSSLKQMILRALTRVSRRSIWSTKQLEAKTHYESLSLQPSATPQAIKSAFYTASKACHPDTVHDPSLKPSALAKFLSVKEAYETLSNPSKRVAYDVRIGLAPQSYTNGTSDFSAWTSSTGVPPTWTMYNEATAQESGWKNPFAFRRDAPHAPYDQEAYSPVDFVDTKTLFVISLTGSLACFAGFWGLVAYYTYAVEDSPSAMKEAENYHRARAIILEYTPVDIKGENYRQRHKDFGYYEGAPPPGGSRNGMYARKVSTPPASPPPASSPPSEAQGSETTQPAP
jgi:hypothetical protein